MSNTLESLVPKTITVVLGGKEYFIQEKSILKMSEWRQKTGNIVDYFIDAIQDSKTDVEIFARITKRIWTSGLDEIVDAFWMYADLPREEIEKDCTDEEIIKASIEVIKLVSPFLRMIMEAIIMALDQTEVQQVVQATKTKNKNK